jgi:hypothetical protein
MNRNRNLPVPAHNYDIVEGPIPDDKVTRRIRRIVSKTVDRGLSTSPAGIETKK